MVNQKVKLWDEGGFEMSVAVTKKELDALKRIFKDTKEEEILEKSLMKLMQRVVMSEMTVLRILHSKDKRFATRKNLLGHLEKIEWDLNKINKIENQLLSITDQDRTLIGKLSMFTRDAWKRTESLKQEIKRDY